jgi:uncharacterized protein (DUF1800 family)
MLTPLDPNNWDRAKAAHLLNRAGFGGTPEEIEALHQTGFKHALEQLLHAPDDSAAFPKPDWAVPRDLGEMRRMMENMAPEERRQKMQVEQRSMREHLFDLVGWWLDRMRRTPNPLREKMTFFWHGHFATSALKVQQAFAMWQQNETLRQNALGNFALMTKSIARDPAMIFYLDTQQNHKNHPNENFARELMELFTLGIGNYTEEDIQQAARTFTCYKIDQRTMSFRLVDFERDDGEKKFFGRTGNFTADDVIDMILQKPACANFIAKKLWTFFADEDPLPELVGQLAESFRASHYEIQPLMEEIFRSAGFYSPAAMRSQIKSPVQWLVQTAKILEIDLPRGQSAINALRQLGQVPLMPPSVKGWDGGKAWINTSTLLLRYNLAGFVAGGGPMPMRAMARNPGGQRPDREAERGTTLDLAKIAPPELRTDPRALVEKLGLRLFQTSLTAKETEVFLKFLEERHGDTSDQTIRGLLNLMMSTPEFQLT